MSIIENNNVIENMEVKVRVKAKSFAQKDKKTMYSIMGFLLNLKEQGILGDDKVMECLEALPLYKTAAEKTTFFQQDMFDTNKVEEELYKPMVSDYKKSKKEKKTRAKKVVVEGEGEVKEKKPRTKKVKSESEGEGEVKEKKPRAKKVVAVEDQVPVPVPVEVETEVKEKEKKPRAKKEIVDGEPKRGRKPKQQIVELAQETALSSIEEEDPLDVLIQSMTQKEKETPTVSVSLEEIRVEDVDDMLRELEAEEMVSPDPVPVPVPKKKVIKNPTPSQDKPVKKSKKATVTIVDNNN